MAGSWSNVGDGDAAGELAVGSAESKRDVVGTGATGRVVVVVGWVLLVGWCQGHSTPTLSACYDLFCGC